MNSRTQHRFVHQACVYGTDEQFLAMALPFVADGLSGGEPVLVTTTSANLELLAGALGDRAQQIDCAETAYLGRRPPQRVTAFYRYWQRHTPATAAGGRVRILAEPVWAGRSARDVTAWQRMESGLNVALADTGIWMICPYDTRATVPDIVAEARRTHPADITGRRVNACPQFVDPSAYARACDDRPLPAPPAGAAVCRFDGDLGALRRFATAQAAAHGLTGDRAALVTVAVGEVGAYCLNHGTGQATVRIWTSFSAIVCHFDQLGGPIADPYVGYRPPDRVPRAGDGLWLARQLSEACDIRSTGTGCTVRLRISGPRVADLLL